MDRGSTVIAFCQGGKTVERIAARPNERIRVEGSLVTEAGLAHGIDKPSHRPRREESGSE
jgi:hypothetical protein